MLMNRFLASFHLSCPVSGLAGSFPAPFCVRPCFPNRWIAERIGPAHPLAHRARVTRVVEAKESRIGKKPVAVPKGVTYTLKDNHLAVKVRAGGGSIATDGASGA